jgi:hypothetical protein
MPADHRALYRAKVLEKGSRIAHRYGKGSRMCGRSGSLALPGSPLFRRHSGRRTQHRHATYPAHNSRGSRAG